jgi:hypothetical protein
MLADLVTYRNAQLDRTSIHADPFSRSSVAKDATLKRGQWKLRQSTFALKRRQERDA